MRTQSMRTQLFQQCFSYFSEHLACPQVLCQRVISCSPRGMISRDATDSEYVSNSMHILAFLESKANHDHMGGGDMGDIEFSHKIQPFRFQVFYPIYLLFPGIPNAPLIVSLYHNTRSFCCSRVTPNAFRIAIGAIQSDNFSKFYHATFLLFFRSPPLSQGGRFHPYHPIGARQGGRSSKLVFDASKV